MADQHQPHLSGPKTEYGFATRAIHAGQDPDPQTTKTDRSVRMDPDTP